MFLLFENTLHANFQPSMDLGNGDSASLISHEQLRIALKNTLDFFKKRTIDDLDQRRLNSLAAGVYNKYSIEKAKEQVCTIHSDKVVALASTSDADLFNFDASIILNFDNFSLILNEEKEELKKSLDYEAGKVRLSAISEGSYVGEEYLLAFAEANAWTGAGSHDEDCPVSVSVWATASGMTNIQAAEDIMQTRILFNQLLIAIRSIRLLGKAAIAASGTSVLANQAFNAAVAQLKAIPIA